MKKAIGALLILMVLRCTAALAFSGTDYPVWDGESMPVNGFNARIGTESIALNFDPTPGYSSWSGGLLQACFFAYDDAERHYLELYLLLPETVAPGDIYAAVDDSPCSLTLYEVGQDSETLYYAGKASGAAFPEGSQFQISIDSVASEGGYRHICGRLEARLGGIASDAPTGDMLDLTGALFCFSMPEEMAQSTPSPTSPPAASAAPDLPQAPSGVQPAFTLPPDYRVI